ncbi:DUF2330 domain-containing protein [Sorangium cellulosum]|uniref:Secreted protein n=1 Tax=Sorangium cellulosum TaxID=56 RepID=A0A150QMI3_SORCE|nr:DUF2330 domain-containing protein [Sorangium cellulosum]KYF69180.1 hypothetical protein BE15_20395 [Sorangium cellulosum]
MHRRSLALALPAVLLSFSGDALAAGALLPGAGQASVEQRVAVAAGPERTTIWTSLRFQGASGPVALVVPVPPLAALDVSSDAWLEALEAATAPRVLPPEGVGPYCPGEGGAPAPFDVTGRLAHEATLKPVEVTVLADVDAVAQWAASAGLALSPETAAQLGALQGVRFAAARFDAPGGPAVTRTLRVAMGGGAPLLPLSLTRAGEGDVLVTAWLLGDGRGALSGAAPVTLPPASLTWDASAQRSDYAELRAEVLGQARDGALVEGAGHDALSRSIAIGSDSVDSVVAAYFARASAYGDLPDGPGSCAAVAAAALASSLQVAASCPRAEHGVVDGAAACAESPRRDETDPELLRCGPIADDLAVGLSGLAPSSVWLTRVSMRLAAGQSGADWPLIFGDGASVSPVVRAGRIRLDECSGDGGGGGAGAGPGGSSGSGPGGLGGGPTAGGSSATGGPSGVDDDPYSYHDDEPVADVGCGCSGTADTVVVDDTDEQGEDVYYDDEYEDDGCSGDTSEPAPEDEYYAEDDGCSGDTSEPAPEDEYYAEDDGCSGDTSEPAPEDEYYAEDDGCSGDTSEPAPEDEYYAEDDGCSGDTSEPAPEDEYYAEDDGCSGDTSEPAPEDEYYAEDDGCSGDTSEPAPEDEYYAEDDGCSGDTSEPAPEDEYYAEDDGCSGDTSEPESEDEYYAEDDGCSGDTSEPDSGDEYYAEDDGCSGGSDDSAESEDCSVAGERRASARKKRGPKLSVMALGAFALIAPLRRASRPRRGERR